MVSPALLIVSTIPAGAGVLMFLAGLGQVIESHGMQSVVGQYLMCFGLLMVGGTIALVYVSLYKPRTMDSDS